MTSWLRYGGWWCSAVGEGVRVRFTGGVSEEGAVSAGGALANLSTCWKVGKLESWRGGAGGRGAGGGERAGGSGGERAGVPERWDEV